jgi:RimJ/RimL family protein N-acetyltransferase
MFDFNKDYILENDKVKLIPLKHSDYENLVQFAIEEPELWTYSLMQANSSEKMKAYIEHALKARDEKKEYPFIVFDKTTNRFAGSTRFYDIQLNNESLQLGFTWYGKDFQGTGLNKNCKFLLLEFAFEILNMQRVEFRADNENKRSIAAMKSIGCVEEGILRSNSPKVDGGRRDSIVLSILKEEWESSVKKNLYLKL